MEDYTDNIEEPGVDLVQLQDFSYRDIRDKNPELKRISKREYLNNKELQEKTMGVRLDGKTWIDDFEFDDNLTIGQDMSIMKNEINEPQPIDDNINNHNNNQFAAGGYVIDPPTRKDSLQVLNSSLKFKDKIKKLNYKKDYEVNYDDYDALNLYKFKNGKLEVNKTNELQSGELKSATNKRPNGDVYLNSNVVRKGGLKSDKKTIGHNIPLLKKEKYNKYTTIEQSAYLGYNTDLPTLLMDGRIKPQKQNTYSLEGTKDRTNDWVVFNEYDPIAVTPFDMLSYEDKKKRVKLYGNSGVPKSYNPKDPKPKELKETKKEISEKVNPKLDPLNLSMADLVRDSGKIESDAKVIPYRPTPKSFKVTETEVNPYGLDDRKEGNNITTYEVENIDNISKRKINGKREIQAQYAEGGEIDPPVRTYGLSPEQKQEVEQQALFTNNWNANRVVNGVKLENGYQIPSTQKVGLKNLSNTKNKEGYERMAEYNPVTDSIGLNKDSYETGRGFPAHEYAHRFQKYTKKLNPDTYEDYINKPISSLIKNENTYDSDPEEIHSELMRLRYNSGFQPDQVIDDSNLQNINLDDYNLNSLDSNSIINLLNSTAYNNNNSSDQNIASHGGKMGKSKDRLTNFEGGGTHQENSLGGIPIGRGSNGKLNTVEEGETRYGFDDGDYIFSNRINTKGLFRDI